MMSRKILASPGQPKSFVIAQSALSGCPRYDTMSSDAEGAQGGITSELCLGRFPHERLEVMLAGERVNVRRTVLRVTLQEQHDSVRPSVQRLLERSSAGHPPPTAMFDTAGQANKVNCDPGRCYALFTVLCTVLSCGFMLMPLAVDLYISSRDRFIGRLREIFPVSHGSLTLGSLTEHRSRVRDDILNSLSVLADPADSRWSNRGS